MNLEIIDPESLQRFKDLKMTTGIEIIPEDPSFCSAMCYPVLINGQLRGAIVLPLVEDYPENKMELISPDRIKEALQAKEGDLLEVEILSVSTTI